MTDLSSDGVAKVYLWLTFGALAGNMLGSVVNSVTKNLEIASELGLRLITVWVPMQVVLALMFFVLWKKVRSTETNESR